MVGRFFAPAAKKVAAIFSRRVPEWKKATVKGFLMIYLIIVGFYLVFVRF